MYSRREGDETWQRQAGSRERGGSAEREAQARSDGDGLSALAKCCIPCVWRFGTDGASKEAMFAVK